MITKTNNNFLHLFSNFYINADSIRKKPIFVHVGTYSGDLERELIKHFPDCKIYSVEPHPDNFNMLCEKTKNMNNVIKINKAIVVDDQENVFIQGSGGGATTYNIKSGLQVEGITIGQLIDEYEIDEIECVFYNAEGTEMDFIPSVVERGLYKKIKQICVNFHVHVPEFKITWLKVLRMLVNIKIKDYYKINDDQKTQIATKATGSPISERYPCFLFFKEQVLSQPGNV